MYSDLKKNEVKKEHDVNSDLRRKFLVPDGNIPPHSWMLRGTVPGSTHFASLVHTTQVQVGEHRDQQVHHTAAI
jgi:hypothetical protein